MDRDTLIKAITANLEDAPDAILRLIWGILKM